MGRPPEVVRFGEFELNLRSGELSRDGHRMLLPDQPFRLLAVLIRERGDLVSREDLRRQLWSDDTFVDFEAGLNAAVKRLREALGDTARAPTFIETLPRRGYRFIASVEELPDPRPPGVPAGLTIALAGVLALTALAVFLALARGPGALGVAGGREARPRMTRVTNLGTVLKASLSPDGQDLAYVLGEGVQESLWVREARSEPRRLLGPVDGSFASLTFAPQGLLYYTFFSPDKTNMALHRLSIRGGAPGEVRDAAGATAFSPDGSRYAYVHNLSVAVGESRVVLSDTRSEATRTLSVRRTPESFVLLKPAWSPDGAHLAVFGASDAAPGRHELVDVDVRTGVTRQIAALDLGLVEGALWLAGAGELIVAARERRAAPQRLWSVSVGSGAVRPLTDDVSDYALVGMRGDGSQVLAIRIETTRSLWAANASSPDHAVRVSEDAGSLHGYDEVAIAPDGQLLYTRGESSNADIWSVDPATLRHQRLTTNPSDDFNPCVSPDGRTVVFTSNAGAPGLWSMSRDGGNLRRLTTGGDTRPSFSPDGTWVAFQRSGVETTPWMVFRVWLQTGEVRRITAPATMRPAVSPDGRFVAHYWMTPDRWALAVTPADGGLATMTIFVEPTHAERVVRWSPDGRALAFIDRRGGASNLWLQPLDKGPRRKLTRFSEGRIASFDWSRDGSKLAWMRVREVRDIVAVGLDRAP